MEAKMFSELANSKSASLQTFSTGIDLTLLDPRATNNDIRRLIDTAYSKKYYGVVVSPIFVKEAKRIIDTEYSSALKVATVIGFPLGSNTFKTKLVEAKEAIKNGTNELEVVINISKVKEGDYGFIKYELARIVRLSRKVLVKAIIETAYLSLDELEKVVQACVKARVDMIQTSTGYAPLGADAETVERIVGLIGKHSVQVKASGGIKTQAQAENLMRVGASRIGTSRII